MEKISDIYLYLYVCVQVKEGRRVETRRSNVDCCEKLELKSKREKKVNELK